jgi:hypothetical protein
MDLSTNKNIFRSIFFSVNAAAVLIYWLTAFRTITWWDSGEYSLAAVTLGVAHPPGSLITTLLGWFVVQFPLSISKAFQLNLFSACLAALTAWLVSLIGFSLISKTYSLSTGPQKSGLRWAMGLGAISGGLTLAFGETLWLYAIKFTPYIFTALLTAIIIRVMIKWWENADDEKSWRWLLLILFLFGLDFSVHRTNLLMLPGLLGWILLRRPRTIIQSKFWIYGIFGLAAGLAIHLLIIPMAARAPFLNMNNPSTLSGFWDYITLKQYGGGWLVNLFPRKGAFFAEQVVDYLNVFGANFLWTGSIVGLAGILPLLLGFTGLFRLLYSHKRMALGLLILFLCTSAGAIIYFNVPSHFFRSMDRHYLPSLVIFAVWISYGASYLIHVILNMKGRHRLPVAFLAALILLAMPLSQIIRNYKPIDSSNNFFTYDTGKNVFETLPADAVIFAGGDTDYWPILYLQQAENIRPDVTILNLNLMNTSWYMLQLMDRDPAFPLGVTREQIARNQIRPWIDTVITVAVQGDARQYQLPDSMTVPETMELRVRPNIADKYLMIQDWLLLQIINANQWKRPLYFSTGLPVQALPGLAPYLRLEGIALRLIPMPSPPLNKEILHKNLMENYQYRGYADDGITLETATRWAGWNLYGAFLQLAQAEYAAGDSVAFRDVGEKMVALLPPSRLQPPAELAKSIAQISGAVPKE